MTTFIAIISLICSILTIILFFKVWRMCDDVKRLAEHFCGTEQNNVDSFNARIAAGDITATSDIRKKLLSELQKISKNAQGMLDEDYEKMYGASIETHITSTKNKYEKLFKAAGQDFPKDIAKIKTIEDLWNLFE